VNDAPRVQAQLDDGGASVAALVNQLSKLLVEQATTHPQLYALLDGLLDVPRAYNPRLKLLTVLMAAAPKTTKAEPKSAPAMITAAPIIAQTPMPKVEPKVEPQPQVTVSKPQPAAEPATEEPNQPATPGSFTAEAWPAVLEATKKTNAPLVTVLKHAAIHFDTAKNELTLGFKYQLHRKKMDDPKQKAIIARVITNLYGGAPSIKTTIGSVQPADPTVASVAEIMGGGEAIEP